MVFAWVGKKFPDMRQNERRIEFIRMVDTLGTAGQLKGELRLSWASSQFLQPQDKENSCGRKLLGDWLVIPNMISGSWPV